jgi:hypothetical protein
MSCRICLGRCDGETHAATLRVHAALRERLKRVLDPPPVTQERGKPYPGIAAVKALICPAAREKEKRRVRIEDERR